MVSRTESIGLKLVRWLGGIEDGGSRPVGDVQSSSTPPALRQEVGNFCNRRVIFFLFVVSMSL